MWEKRSYFEQPKKKKKKGNKDATGKRISQKAVAVAETGLNAANFTLSIPFVFLVRSKKTNHFTEVAKQTIKRTF